MEMTGVQRLVASGLVVLALAGCSKVPEAKKAYIGEWQGGTIKLKVTRAAWVDYNRTADIQLAGEGAVGALVGFEGDDILIGGDRSHPAFTVHVTAPPHQENGRWTMSVDGVRITRD